MRIGILTLYHNSTNYGGVLQAYALVEFLRKNGYDAEQIDFDFRNVRSSRSLWQRIVSKKGKILVNLANKKISAIRRRLHLNAFLDYDASMNNAFFDFRNNLIPHSGKCYSGETIAEVNSIYDTFIVGSDQIWNFAWNCEAFFLPFISQDKKRISYAASIIDLQSDVMPNNLKTWLCSFDAISVREKETLSILSSLIEHEVIHCVDPTMLLDVNAWDALCSPKLIEEPYVLCYFLGINKNARKCAKQYAQQNGLIVVDIPVQDQEILGDYGDEKVIATPNEFLSLIKYSNCVFTDSFHASVFSYQYQKQLFIFRRNARNDMSSRIRDLVDLLDIKQHYCSEHRKENIAYINSLSTIDYSIHNWKYEQAIRDSKIFLFQNIDPQSFGAVTFEEKCSKK